MSPERTCYVNYVALFDRQSALRARWRKGGLHRAAFWAKLGHPNLVKARAVWAEMRAQRKLAAEQSEQRERVAKQQQSWSLLDSTREDNY